IVAQGTPDEVAANPASLTGQYLSGARKILVPAERREGNGKELKLVDAHLNNLKHLDVSIPLGKFVCVTGVSGSGKSTLINEVLQTALSHHLSGGPRPQGLKELKGWEHLDK